LLSRSLFLMSAFIDRLVQSLFLSLSAGLTHAHTNQVGWWKKSDDCYRVFCSFSSFSIDLNEYTNSMHYTYVTYLSLLCAPSLLNFTCTLTLYYQSIGMIHWITPVLILIGWKSEQYWHILFFAIMTDKVRIYTNTAWVRNIGSSIKKRTKFFSPYIL
jgi:hypothetical protein